MNDPLRTRRQFLRFGAHLSTAGLILATTACGSEDKLASCAPGTSDNDGLRTSLGYSEKTPDQASACQYCAFFTGEGGCGQCELLQSTVNANGTCNSWSARG